MIDEIMEDAKSRMDGALRALDDDLGTFRTGRASPQLLDRIEVEMYGTMMPLAQVASIKVPEPQTLAIKPYDVSMLTEIERAILKSDLGMNPNNDGNNIWLSIPRLTEDRRKDMAKQVNKRMEESRVAVRNVRRSALKDLREMKDESMISENEFYGAEERVQKLTDEYIDKVDGMGKAKQDEIMTV